MNLWITIKHTSNKFIWRIRYWRYCYLIIWGCATWGSPVPFHGRCHRYASWCWSPTSISFNLKEYHNQHQYRKKYFGMHHSDLYMNTYVWTWRKMKKCCIKTPSTTQPREQTLCWFIRPQRKWRNVLLKHRQLQHQERICWFMQIIFRLWTYPNLLCRIWFDILID